MLSDLYCAACGKIIPLQTKVVYCKGATYHEECYGIPDTGKRTEFDTGAVRDSMEGKGFPHMIPPCAIRAVAKRFEDGAKKYSAHNWMKGIPLSRYYDSAMRHLMSWSEGDVTEKHLHAAGWNICCAIWTQEQIENGKLPKELNDLPYFKADEPPAAR